MRQPVDPLIFEHIRDTIEWHRHRAPAVEVLDGYFGPPHERVLFTLNFAAAEMVKHDLRFDYGGKSKLLMHYMEWTFGSVGCISPQAEEAQASIEPIWPTPEEALKVHENWEKAKKQAYDDWKRPPKTPGKLGDGLPF